MNIKPYVYHITHIPTNKCYVGSRIANKVSSKEDFWKIYFTSSVCIKKLIEEYGVESFKIDWIIDYDCLLYTSPSPRDKRQSRMPSSA